LTIWSPRVNRFFRAKLAAAPFFSDYSDEVAGGGDTVRIPHISDSFSASDINTTSGEVSATNVDDTKTDLSIDKWKGTSIYLTDFQKAQIADKYRIKDEYASTMGYTLARTFDSALLDEAADNLTYSVGDTGTDLVATNIERAFSILGTENVPKEDAVMFVHPTTYWGDIMNIQKYYDASQFGKPSVPQGAHDLLYGVPVVITSQVPTADGGGYNNMLIHRNAVVYALGNLQGPGSAGARIQEKTAEDLRVKVIADIMYGVKILNSKSGVKMQAGA
jgi:hypothetical protein